MYPTVGENTNDVFSTVPEPPASVGTLKKLGMAKFFLIGEISYNPSTWGNQVQAAGQLSSTYTRPNGWSDTGASSHEMVVEWNCLDGKRGNLKVTAN